MKQILTNIIGIILLGSATSSFGQSLDSLINTALENNYQIKILKNNSQVATNNNTWGNAGKQPTIDLNAGVSTSYNSTKQSLADGSVNSGNFANNTNINASLLMDWTLFDGFRVQATKERLEYLEDLSDLDSKFFIEQTVSDIVMAYNQLIYEHQLLKNYEQSLDISSNRLNIESKRKDAGAGSGMTYGQALVDYQTDSIIMLAQLNTIESLEIELNRVINSDLEQRYSPDLTFEMEALPTKDSLLSAIKESNKQMQTQRLQELLAETDLRLAKADKYPTISLFAGAQYSQSFAQVGFVKSNRSVGPTFGLNINYNLFNGGATKRNLENSILMIENSTFSKEDINNDLDAATLDLYRQYVSIQQRIALAHQNIDAMDKVYNSASEQLKRGAINGFDFRSTQTSLLNTELTLIQLQFMLKAVEININRLSGNVVEAYMNN